MICGGSGERLNKMYSSFRIIAVDDDELTLLSLQNQLASLGVESIYCIDDVEQGMKLLGDQSFDILFLDLNMPKMTGIEVINALAKANYAGCIVLLSCVDQSLIETSKEIAQSQGLNVIATFHKPIERKVLQEMMNLILE